MLVASGLGHRFGENVALQALNLEVRSGEIVCLLGANGAGKTTTINLFLGFLTPTSGTVSVDGIDPSTRPLEARRKVAYLPEQVALYPSLTGLENLAFFQQLAEGRARETEELIIALGRVGLDAEAARQPVSTYSKGMRQKVGLAIALARDCGALLLDEPMSGLDPSAANEFTALLETLRDRGMAVLMATHDIFRAREVGSRVGIMKRGRLIADLATDALSPAELERVYLEHMRD
jgi:ABC-2 type transport system ATP-binding protein